MPIKLPPNNDKVEQVLSKLANNIITTRSKLRDGKVIEAYDLLTEALDYIDRQQKAGK